MSTQKSSPFRQRAVVIVATAVVLVVVAAIAIALVMRNGSSGSSNGITWTTSAGWTGIEVDGDSRSGDPGACTPQVVDAAGKSYPGQSQQGSVRFDLAPGQYTVSDENWNASVTVTVPGSGHVVVQPPAAQSLVGCLS